MRYTMAILAGLFLFSISWSEGDVPANQLLAVFQKGTAVTGKIFFKDEGEQASVAINSIQSKEKALCWDADLDIDCDGESDNKCNSTTDPWFYPAVAAGKGIYASKTPFYVIPTSFNSKTYGVDLGSVGAVVYKGKVSYGPLLDLCAMNNVIGEASYAMAESLGINPDPQVGGTDGSVIYFAFAGTAAKLSESNYSNHAKALEIGNARAKELVEFFGVTAAKDPKQIISAQRIVLNTHSISLPDISVNFAGNHTVSVVNVKGQQVFSAQGTGRQHYSIPGLRSGLYMIRISGPEAVFTERVILQNRNR